MVRKNWIVIGCVAAMVVMLCAVAYAEKEKAVSLPAAVESAVKAMFPKATIEKSKMEEAEIKTYEVEMKDASMNIGADGTVMTVETVEDVNALPAAVAAAVKGQNGKVSTVEKEVKHAELKLVKLDKPVTSYEAKINKDGKDMEVVIAADGKILEQKAVEKEEKGDKEEKKCGKEKDEDDKD